MSSDRVCPLHGPRIPITVAAQTGWTVSLVPTSIPNGQGCWYRNFSQADVTVSLQWARTSGTLYIDDVLLVISQPRTQSEPSICRLSVAEPAGQTGTTGHVSHLRVASKYPNLTRRHFERQGVQAEVVKLNGAMELAPILGLSSRIVDLVSTGKTLKDFEIK